MALRRFHDDAGSVWGDQRGCLPPSDGDIVDSAEQHPVQVGTGQGEAWADAVPQLIDVNVEQHPAAVICGPLPSDVDGALGDLGAEPNVSRARTALPGR